MGTIYGGIPDITAPKFTENWEAYQIEITQYENQVKHWAKENGSGAEAGEDIYFPVADGNAHYVVLSLKPVKLIHLDVIDGYHFPYIKRLTAKDIKEQLSRQKLLNDIFSGKKSEKGV